MLIFEIGAGFNTPGIIGWPMERLVQAGSDAYLVRMNPQWPQVPQEIAGRAVPLQGSAWSTISANWKGMGFGNDDAGHVHTRE